jgi:hypothetical protein
MSDVTNKKYPLSESKTFAAILFPADKESLAASLDNFTSKTGKFFISGFPQELCLLSNGSPGAGKKRA